MPFNPLLGDNAGTNPGEVYLRDYAHGARVFRSGIYSRAPKLKFLYHTYFEINPAAAQTTSFTDNLIDRATGQPKNFGLITKSAKLPSFNVQHDELNQYNRKRLVQTKMKYDPCDITLHDDHDNSSTKLWESYYNYYYTDGRIPQVRLGTATPVGGDPSYNTRNPYQGTINTTDWGFAGGQTGDDGYKVPFFKQITVFGFSQQKFTAYTFINPIITNWSHDTYDYSSGDGTMTNTMTINYESVAYNYGVIKDGSGNPGSIAVGFGQEESYDTILSHIALPGATRTIYDGLDFVTITEAILEAKNGNYDRAIRIIQEALYANGVDGAADLLGDTGQIIESLLTGSFSLSRNQQQRGVQAAVGAAVGAGAQLFNSVFTPSGGENNSPGQAGALEAGIAGDGTGETRETAGRQS